MKLNFSRIPAAVITVGLSGLLPLSVEAETVELAPVADVSILYSSTPPLRQNFLNAGAGSLGASVHSGAAGRGTCSLLRFEVSEIPANATITSAELFLNPKQSYPQSTYTAGEALAIYQIAGENAGWVEGAGTRSGDHAHSPIAVPGANGSYVNMDSYTDEQSHSGVRWLSGKTLGLMDFEGEEIGGYSLSDDGLTKNQPLAIPLDPGAIQAWLADPNLAKAGLALWMRSDENPVERSRFAIFESREDAAPPQLVISYTLE